MIDHTDRSYKSSVPRRAFVFETKPDPQCHRLRTATSNEYQGKIRRLDRKIRRLDNWSHTVEGRVTFYYTFMSLFFRHSHPTRWRVTTLLSLHPWKPSRLFLVSRYERPSSFLSPLCQQYFQWEGGQPRQPKLEKKK